MCGLVGFSYGDRAQMEALLPLIRHRGPDQSGIWEDGQVTLGHQRLSILDLSERGRQPMHSSDGRYHLVFNGEIFNYRELRTELEQTGHTFVSDSDTEVLLQAYMAWGENMLNRLNGQFAFALYDVERSEILLARDRLGIKPLYYALGDRGLQFASELKVLMRASDSLGSVSEAALQDYFLLGYFPDESTPFETIQKLLPGHLLRYSVQQQELLELKPYWNLSFQEAPQRISEVEACEQVRGLLAQSVQRRMVADVPLGAFLSGGIDSSIIVALMRQQVEDLKTFSIGFDVPGYDESHWAELVARHFTTDHYQTRFGAEDILKMFDDLLQAFDEPFGDSSMLPMYLVAKVAKQEVTVCLSGTGGDELFVGYRRYQRFLLRQRLSRLPRWLRNPLLAMAQLKSPGAVKRLRNLLDHPQLSSSYLYHRPALPFWDAPAGQSFNRLAQRMFEPLDDEKEKALNRLLHFDQSQYLPNDLLVKEDRASMAHSLEARVPFLDHELLEYVNALPLQLKFIWWRKKALLKKAFSGVLPAEVLRRKKMGFGVPVGHYLRGPWKAHFESRLLDSDAPFSFAQDIRQQLWEEHQQGQADHSVMLWRLLMYHCWHDRWMK